MLRGGDLFLTEKNENDDADLFRTDVNDAGGSGGGSCPGGCSDAMVTLWE